MKKKTIGKIQVVLGIILVIATIVALFYSSSLLLKSYNDTTLAVLNKYMEQKQYILSNETLAIYGLEGVGAFTSLSGDYLVGGVIIVVGGVIVIIVSVNMILQGLANIGES